MPANEEATTLIRSLEDAELDCLSKTLGAALVGSDITRMFTALGIVDSSGESTKWKRLYYTFREIQQNDKCANRIGAFVESALSPARWSTRGEEYRGLREAMNKTLLLAGLECAADGKLRQVTRAVTIDEATERANRLRAKLDQRDVHRDVLRYCQRVFLKDDNYFHAVFEVTKGLAERLRTMSGSVADGNVLVDETLEKGTRPFPILALNRYDTASYRNDQSGVAHLARGLFHAFRNVTAHEPSIRWTISLQDALDMMSIASLIHRRLDSATVTTAFQPAK